MNLDHLKEELDEFEDFVSSYTKQMNDILSGKAVDIKESTLKDIPQPKKTQDAEISEATGSEKVEAVKPQPNAKPSAPGAAATAAEKVAVTKPKIPKTSLDYSRFEKIDESNEPEDVSPTPAAKPNPPKLETKKQPPPKPYSLKAGVTHKTIPEKITEIANTHKALGNEAIRVSNPTAAVKHYTDAIETCVHPKRQQILEYEKSQKKAPPKEDEEDPFEFLNKMNLPDPEGITPDPALYSNRAYSRLCLLDFTGSVEDCTQVFESKAEISLQIRVKTLWRRSLAYRAIGQLTLAKSDLMSLLKHLTNETDAKKKSELISQADAERALRVCEEEISLEVESRSKKESVEANTRNLDSTAIEKTESLNQDSVALFLQRKSFEAVIDKFVTEIKAKLDGFTAASVNAPYGPKPVAIIKSDSITSYADTLVTFLSEPAMHEPSNASIFRVYDGFEKIFGDGQESQESSSIISPSSIHILLPILLASLKTSEENRKSLAKHNRLTQIVKSVLECPLVFSNITSKDPTTPQGLHIIQQASQLVRICAEHEPCLFEITTTSGFHAGTAQTWSLFLKTALGMLTVESTPLAKRIHPSLPAATPEIANYLFGFMEKLLHFPPTTLFQKLGCSVSSLMSSLDTWFPETPDVCCETLTALVRVASSTKPVQTAVEESRNSLTFHLATLMQKNASTLFLTTLHNLITINQMPFPDSLLTQTDLIPVLIRHLGRSLNSDVQNKSVALATLAKIQSRNSARVAKDLDGWWDEVGMVDRLRGWNKECGVDDAGCWVQLLAGWLQQAGVEKEQGRVVESWKGEGGFDLLIDLVRDLVKTVSVSSDKQAGWIEKVDRLIGNIGLAIAECCKKEDNAKYFHRAGLTDMLVDLLRVVSKRPNGQKGAQKNISIACARLCQYEPARDHMRELKGMELLYTLGSRVV